MPNDITRGDDRWRWIVILTELALLNLFLVGIWELLGLHTLDKTVLAWNVSYVAAVLFCPPVVFRRSVRSEQIATSVLRTSLWLIFIFYTLLIFLRIGRMRFYYYIIFAVCVFLFMLIFRLLWSVVIKRWRFSGNDNVRAVFVGDGDNLNNLYNDMTDDTSMGYRVVGYFSDEPSQIFPSELPLLGDLNDVINWLMEHPVDYLFCNIPSRRYGNIQSLIDYCENHLIHFFSVPNVIHYAHHKMRVQFIGNSIVLSLRNEPLRAAQARFIKRTFDIVFSFLVCLLFLWWLIPIVALITTFTMPGPIFFRQKRNGLNNKEFYCLKFRTMVVNKDADNLQATADDDRITKWGHFMRKMNIDEFPQFINVLLGDMSVVGPRPHMLKHNDEYSKMIDKYVIRSYLRPGITGWAQVTGSRGETRTIKDMEERIVKDIWYIENWTFMLDILIIFRTVFNMFGAEKGNAY